MKSAFEKAHKARFGFIDRSKQLVVEAVSVEAVGGGAKFRERAHKTSRGKLPSPARAHRILLQRQMAQGRGLSPATSSRPATRSTAPPSSSSRTRPSWSRTAGAPRSPPRTISCWSASCRSHAPERDRHQGRSDHARGVQQPVHVDRRADGRVAAEHRLFGQHQGAARLLLRGVRRRRARWSPTRRTCRCISARWTARSRPSSARTRARSSPGDVLPDQRALQRRHPHPRPHRLHAGVRQRQAARSCSGSRAAAITPTSAASRRARCRRSPPRSKRKASTSTTSSWSIAASSASARSTTCSPRRKYPARNPLQNVNDLKAQIAANEKGVQELHKMVGAVRPATSCTPT